MTTTTQQSKPAPADNAQAHLAAFDTFEKGGARRFPAWVNELRRAGISRFTALGFPTRRLEDWKYTNVAPISQLPFKPAVNPMPVALSAADLARFAFAGLDGSRLVFVNGHFVPGLSAISKLSVGVKLGSLAAAMSSDGDIVKQHLGRYASATDHAFRALNVAFFADGAFIYVPKGVVVEEPIHLLFVAVAGEDGTAAHPRNLIVAEAGSRLKVVESYVSVGSAAGFTNAVTEIAVGEGANVEHCKFQDESLGAFHVATIQSSLARNSRFTSHSISVGAQIARHDINAVMTGEGVECVLNGLYVASGSQLVDHHMVVDHAQPRCASHEFFHGILGGKSRGVFNGKIFVRPGAQQTDAKQTNRNLLLTDDATVDTKPQLEIFADDVKCMHGATVGRLDEDAIFYLRSRGIPHNAARRMLTQAFASNILARIGIEPVRKQLDEFLQSHLDAEIRAVEG
ncbi:MAG: Fe-S cluster assembly protein SufD [Verrucomicrobia bacterium]|nr:Fe-S cluster assembly protein SufD [Verrucomicrobiota bacterium]